MKPDPEYPMFLRNEGYMHGDPIPAGYVPVELLTADEQATIMYACQHSDAGRLTRPEEVKLVSLVRKLIERIGGSDGD